MISWVPPAGCTRLVLVRHAEPDEAMRGRCYGSLDVGLSSTGRAQARRLCAALAEASIDAIYSSPRLRARETVIALPRAVQIVDALREIDFGIFEGLTYEAAAQHAPDVYRAWMTTPTDVAFPGGECYADVRARVRGVAATIRAKHACALIVAHGGTVRTILAEALQMDDADIFRLDIAHASVSIVDTFADGTPVVRLVNAHV
jgi:alpha-ribazole phosphatase